MKRKFNKNTLNKIVENAAAKKDIYGAVFYVSSNDNSIDLVSAAGNIKEESQYYIASINKLFISSIILNMREEKVLDLDDKIADYLPEQTVRGLHIYKGTDYSNVLTINHLISLTSGLPCYLMDKQANGHKAMSELEAGMDQAWPIEKVLNEVKKMKPYFPPGKKGKAKYIDTNHQVLSLIIEAITGEPIKVILNKLFYDLNLNETYVYENIGNEKFIPIRYKSNVLNVPLFLSSTQTEIISTAKDQMTFIKAFFNGYFFPEERLPEIMKWHKIFFPFKYGTGIQQFRLPRIFSPFNAVTEMIGHSGSTGSVAFYVPDKDIYITGTTNQQARPNIAFQTMLQIIGHLNT